MDEAKERARTVWSSGNYAPFGTQLEPASTQLVESAGVRAGQSLLDVAAGNGNLALAAARAGARVTATDFSEVMISNGIRRTSEAGLEIEWQVADAEDLPFDDDQFDVVTSVFGVMFAGAQKRAAHELFRTARSGGKIAVTAWTPEGYTGDMFEVMDRYGPAWEPNEASPLTWGTEAGIRELFDSADDISFTRRNITFAYPSWAAMQETQEAHGVFVVLKQHMPADRFAALTEALGEVTRKHNRATGEAVEYDSEYLEVVIRK